jgi:hypothetical protein
MLALFNMHLSQSESFKFKEAEATLNEARAIDSQQLAELLTAANTKGDGPAVLDASLQMGSVWYAALGGNDPQQVLTSEERHGLSWLGRQFVNPVSVIGLLTLIGCSLLPLLGRAEEAARRCIRCGRPFCHFCKSGREGHEYCSQCLHLFVLGDGLAPETKMRKIYEVEQHERRSRNGRRLLSTVLPGAAQLLRGRAGLGIFLLVAWFGSLIAWQPGVLRPVERFAGLNLRLDLLGPESIPAIYDLNPFTLIAVPVLLAVWLAANVWRWKGREA